MISKTLSPDRIVTMWSVTPLACSLVRDNRKVRQEVLTNEYGRSASVDVVVDEGAKHTESSVQHTKSLQDFAFPMRFLRAYDV